MSFWRSRRTGISTRRNLENCYNLATTVLPTVCAFRQGRPAQIDRPRMVQLMNRLGTFSEWGQAVVLNQLAKFVPQAPPRGRERGKQRESPFVLSYLILPYLI